MDIKAYTPEPQCTVCVTGLNKSASEDLLELYFDNEKKSGGCNVQNIQIDESKRTAYVTFETEEGEFFFVFDWSIKRYHK